MERVTTADVAFLLCKTVCVPVCLVSRGDPWRDTRETEADSVGYIEGWTGEHSWPRQSFFNSEKLLLSLPRQSSMDAKRVTYSCTYSQGWLQELLISRKCSNWYYMFHEFWRHGLPVSGQGLNVYTKFVIPTFCIFEMSWIHEHLRSLKKRVLSTPPHLCPYIHECPKFKTFRILVSNFFHSNMQKSQEISGITEIHVVWSR